MYIKRKITTFCVEERTTSSLITSSKRKSVRSATKWKQGTMVKPMSIIISIYELLLTDVMNKLQAAQFDLYFSRKILSKLPIEQLLSAAKKVTQFFLASQRTTFIEILSYHPQSNRIAENLVKSFKTTFKRLRLEETKKEEIVKIFLKVSRNVPSVTTGKSPIEVMCGGKSNIFLKENPTRKEEVKK